ncbi:MAG: CBS domain-containing protein [Planctomycetes bacterium]|nr:CBS domain-containing protein [Planctomycetota bacterium]MCC7398054.1 CBS domain-containing protein [Planctomycetota bacterium]
MPPTAPTPSTSPSLAAATLLARDIMQRDIITVQASDTVKEVERVLVDARISGAPVLDDDGQLLGIVSMHDIMRHHADCDDLPTTVDSHVFDDLVDETETVAFERDGDAACAGDLMTTEVIGVRPDALLTEVAAVMVKAGVHRVIVRSGRRLLGIVSSMDLMRAFSGAARPKT